MQEYFAAYALIRRHTAGEDLADLWRVPVLEREMPPAERGEWDPLPGPPTTAGSRRRSWRTVSIPTCTRRCSRSTRHWPRAVCWRAGRTRTRRRVAQSQDDLLERLGNVAVHVRSRIEAGLLLGRLGDPRFPVETVNGVKVILPPMVEIAGGVATIGSGLWQRLRGAFCR